MTLQCRRRGTISSVSFLRRDSSSFVLSLLKQVLFDPAYPDRVETLTTGSYALVASGSAFRRSAMICLACRRLVHVIGGNIHRPLAWRNRSLMSSSSKLHISYGTLASASRHVHNVRDSGPQRRRDGVFDLDTVFLELVGEFGVAFCCALSTAMPISGHNDSLSTRWPQGRPVISGTSP